jgi:hypothetical protein
MSTNDTVNNTSSGFKDDITSGLPSLCLLPARDYKLILGEDDYIITVPKKGNFKDIIDSSDFVGIEAFDGEFTVYDDESGIFYPPVFTSVALALEVYPSLVNDASSFQIFSVKAVVSKGEEVSIIGEVVSLLTE